ncbi:NAD(P)-dependent dehydrogenase, short-chain alcohol dehydrogenase family [Actinokineospora alba]|uniref:NAD(P)-dependent dehydrogenase, short-chain alcohol dehydrogenase family n=1 Tax=Actinokineospora alba TaxID=504798 RepID=A0A1H0WMT9_9PSEU|nr:SDR family NAD(P)-dependent oxidoreductase [Actinokineospora alba]TDP67170.1 NAD(P)-dependent dehydrogenase (short-subunit alcohol dehydrogenase family) [Actinokineospora alba]SDJ53756.1 NAD(P)-dependent dehydrogenase, short-chain alcohol dehydrogenase family [Actinokineospora alba]SDP92029.1 NAD(P)-dependent dehydrogenase, short-chain alcohol dehydrogenase family [Actinokineospora alba]
MNRYQDKSVIITGAAGAIGVAVAKRLGQEGARLLLVGSGRTPLTEAVFAVESTGGKCATVEVDVTTSDGVQAYLAAAGSTFGRVDVLINLAGIEGHIAPLTEQDDDSFDRVLLTNTRSVYLGIKHAAPIMIEQGGGVIINMSSAAGVMGMPLFGPYVASKHAVLGLTKSAASELGPYNVRVAAVMPGPIDSPMIERLEQGAAKVLGSVEAVRAAYTGLAADRRYGTVDEVAAAVAFIGSDEASHMHGTYLRVDGGMSALSA